MRLLAATNLAILYLVWGSTYLAITAAVRTSPPLFGMGIRFLVAGFILLDRVRVGDLQVCLVIQREGCHGHAGVLRRRAGGRPLRGEDSVRSTPSR
ncbi:hypothetical protein LWC34_15800 [Kibdelosporangium philippinense]|uniref:EamA domain-containing protein n=1 Tax=Kibdelosporangium philippinense TaxID=211113 RepID=A0ABS8ZB77_9PSEU|nr:hypothetical protein [Kibdelosporangium philippinense]MCE7004288.1 hypothetical protein [Kibdelosporangium philippinense]